MTTNDTHGTDTTMIPLDITTNAHAAIANLAVHHNLRLQDFHIEGRWAPKGESDHVAYAFGVKADDNDRSPVGYYAVASIRNGEIFHARVFEETEWSPR